MKKNKKASKSTRIARSKQQQQANRKAKRNIIIDTREPKEIVDLLKKSGSEVKPVTLARRAFQDL